MSPGAKTWAVEPGGVCPRYGPSAKGFPNTWIEPTAKTKTITQYISFFFCFITNLPLLRVELVSNVIIPQKEFCFIRNPNA
jgi:hypothetical protein